MTLEDFFTLTEMKDGLAATSRVRELISVMQKEKDSVVKNIGDASRHWAAVASTIAATENKDCLELFIQLDGLWFIDRWLKDALKHGPDTSDSLLEESIMSLLRALEKLKIDRERSISSGILVAINNLLNHSSSRVQDRARMLVDGWKQSQIGDTVDPELQSVSSCCDVSVLPSESDKSLHGTHQVNKHEVCLEFDANTTDPTREERLVLKSSDSVYSEGCQNDKFEKNDELVVCRGIEDKPLDGHTTSITSGSGHESLSWAEKVPIGATAADQSQNCLFPDESDVASNNLKPGNNTSSVISSSNNVSESASAPTTESKDAGFCAVTTTFEDQEKPVCLVECNSNAIGDANNCGAQTMGGKDMDVHFDSHTGQDLSDHECKLDKTDEAGTSYSRMGIDASDGFRGYSSDTDIDLDCEFSNEEQEDISRFSKAVGRKRSPDLTDKKLFDSEQDYGTVDALEVARLVAQDVARQVGDYKEPACSSSSEKILKIGFRQPGSPDSISGKPENPAVVPPENVSSTQNHSAEAYSEGEGQLIASNHDDVGNGANEQESSQVTEVAQEPEVNDERGFCGLDLNQEVCSGEIETIQNPVSTTASVVSASRLAAASGSLAGCIQFQGVLGWKGSSATSAFRPASPCKMIDSDRTHETSRFSDGLQQRQNFLDIDLNMSEDGDEKPFECKLGKPIAISTGFHSMDSALEVNLGSRISMRPDLDLNRPSDDDDDDSLPSDARTERQLFIPRNGHHIPSAASSSSPLQPSHRNFDLNDQPLFPKDSSDKGLYLGKSSQNVDFGGSRTRDPVISLFGARVEVGNRRELSTKELIPQAQLLPNGKPPQPAIDVNFSRMGGVLGMVPTVPYGHPPAFGYNALTTAPPMSVPPAMYGPRGSIPYMLDSIGSHVMPQLVGSSSSVPLSYAQQPFFMNMAGAPISYNSMVPSRPMFDLNSGSPMEGANPGLIRQFFMPSQGRSSEEHMGSNSQASSSSGAGAKRKEPSGGWEPFSLHYKHPTQPWR